MDLVSVLQLLRRRWIPIVACILTGIAGAVVVTRTTPATYHATARVFVNIPAARTAGEALQGVQLSSQLLASYSEIATSRLAGERISERLDRRFSAGEVQAKVTARADADTLFINVSARDTEPDAARDLANASAEVLDDLIEEFEPSRPAQAGPISTGAAPAQVDARIIDRALAPRVPVTPQPQRDLTLGIALGVAAGLALALVLEALDRSITTPEQATAAFGAPVLATLPRQRRLDTEPLIALEGATSPAGEAYRSLRTSLRFLNAERPLVTILVTSAGAGEGKTTVSANLAIAVAQAGERVIVIDADLRRSRLASLFEMEGCIGLTDVVFGRASLTEALQPWRGSLSVLPPGKLPPNPSEVLGSEAMAEILRKASDAADVVIIDAPPVLPVTDATVLSTLVDGTILVANWAQTEVSGAEEARFTLDGVDANVVGVVLNSVRGRRSANYYHEYSERASEGAAP